MCFFFFFFISFIHCAFQPPQFKLDPRLARLLGIHTQTRSCIIQALWQYVKTNKLQDSHEKEYINCDKYFQQALTYFCYIKYSLYFGVNILPDSIPDIYMIYIYTPPFSRSSTVLVLSSVRSLSD